MLCNPNGAAAENRPAHMKYATCLYPAYPKQHGVQTSLNFDGRDLSVPVDNFLCIDMVCLDSYGSNSSTLFTVESSSYIITRAVGVRVPSGSNPLGRWEIIGQAAYNGYIYSINISTILSFSSQGDTFKAVLSPLSGTPVKWWMHSSYDTTWYFYGYQLP